MRRYVGVVADNIRWEGFEFRDDDIVITAPSKCGTTWMQTMVGMLIFDSTKLTAPMGELSPWLDMLTRPADEVHRRLSEQTHRRFIKSHTPLDGIPWRDDVTYLAILRHPLDVAMSMRDHLREITTERVRELVDSTAPGHLESLELDDPPEDDAEYLRWWIDATADGWEDGAANLAEFTHQAATYWRRRDEPNVHLFHYDDLWNDLGEQMRRLAAALGVTVDEDRWPEFMAAAGLESMRSRAADLVPENDLDIWKTPTRFFGSGGRRGWSSLLDADDIERLHRRLEDLAGSELAAWLTRDPHGSSSG